MTAFLLTHSSSCGRVETALTEGAQQGCFPNAGISDQDHFKQAVWGKQFFRLL